MIILYPFVSSSTQHAENALKQRESMLASKIAEIDIKRAEYSLFIKRLDETRSDT